LYNIGPGLNTMSVGSPKWWL